MALPRHVLPPSLSAESEPSAAPPSRGVVRERRRAPGASRSPFAAASLFALFTALMLAVIWIDLPAVLQAVAGAVEWLGANASPRARAVASVLLVAAAMLGYVLAWARANAPGRPVRLPHGRGTIAVDEIAGQLRARLLERRDVSSAHVAVENRKRRGVWISALVHVTADARLAETAEAVEEVAAELVVERLGLALAARPGIEFRYEELNLRSERADDQRRRYGAGRDERGRRPA